MRSPTRCSSSQLWRSSPGLVGWYGLQRIPENVPQADRTDSASSGGSDNPERTQPTDSSLPSGPQSYEIGTTLVGDRRWRWEGAPDAGGVPNRPWRQDGCRFSEGRDVRESWGPGHEQPASANAQISTHRKQAHGFCLSSFAGLQPKLPLFTTPPSPCLWRNTPSTLALVLL